MEEIKIFLASGYELELDRIRIGDLIRQMNDDFVQKNGPLLKLIKWEDFPSFYSPSGTQNDYNTAIRNCNIFIGLFWHRAGKHTIEEVNIAKDSGVSIHLFRKTQETLDNEEVAARDDFLKHHSDEEIKEARLQMENFFDPEPSTYDSFDSLSQKISDIISECIQRNANDKSVEKTPPLNTSQKQFVFYGVHSPETKWDFLGISDTIRRLNDSSHDIHIRLLREPPEKISDSDIFISLYQNSISEDVSQQIEKAMSLASKADSALKVILYEKDPADKEKIKDFTRRFGHEWSQYYPVSYKTSSDLKWQTVMQYCAILNQRLQIKEQTVGLLQHDQFLPLMFPPSFFSDDEEMLELQSRISTLRQELDAAQNNESNQKNIAFLNAKICSCYRQLDALLQERHDLALDVLKTRNRNSAEIFREASRLVLCGNYKAASKALDTSALLPGVSSRCQNYIKDNEEQRIKKELLALQQNEIEREDERLRLDAIAIKTDIERFLLDATCVARLNKSKSIEMQIKEQCDKYFAAYQLAHALGPDFPAIKVINEILTPWGRGLDNASHYYEALIVYMVTLMYYFSLQSSFDSESQILQIMSLTNNDPKALIHSKDYDDAIRVCQSTLEKQCFSIKQSSDKKLHLFDILSLTNDIGLCLINAGDHNRALPFCQTALEKQKEYGNEFLLSRAYYNLGALWNLKGNPSKAIENFLVSLKIDIKNKGMNHPDIASIYHELGDIYVAKGELKLALQYVQKSSDIYLSALKEMHPLVSKNYYLLSVIYSALGEYDQALKYANKALNIDLQLFGDKHHQVATDYIAFGLVFLRMGDYDKVLMYLQKSLNINNLLLVKYHPDISFQYRLLGKIWYKKGNVDKALEYANNALNIDLHLLGDNHYQVATDYYAIGLAFFKMDNFDKALENVNKAIEIYLKVYKENDFMLAVYYETLGDTWAAIAKNCHPEKKHFLATIIHSISSNNRIDSPAATMPQANGASFSEAEAWKNMEMYYRKAVEIASKFSQNGDCINILKRLNSNR